jgi:hypothetical protein
VRHRRSWFAPAHSSVVCEPRHLQRAAGVLDLRDAGETRGKHRFVRIMEVNKINAVRGYKTLRRVAGRPSIISPNRVQREFAVDQPNRVRGRT